MSRALRIPAVAATSMVLALALAGCFGGGATTDEPSEPAPDTQAQEMAANEEALQTYVEAEQATIPQALEQNPGLYSDVSIEGVVEEVSGEEDRADGTYSTISFTYSYANPVDWATAGPALDAQRSTLDDACASAVFPSMRAAGVTGSLSALYAFGDGGAPQWEHLCVEQ